jgi:RNA ligase
MFPLIAHINDLRPHVEHMEEVRFAVQPNGYTVVCVMVNNKETYSGNNSMWVRECRGITFDRDGFIASRGLHKFFNVGEREETFPNKLSFEKTVRLMNKLDGSIINSLVIDQKVQFKSKKSFESEVAIIANRIATLNQKIFAEYCHEYGLSPSFELTTPEKRIVIKYPDSSMRLLHVRDNISGRYLSSVEIQMLASKFDIDVVDEYTLKSWDEICKELEVVENFEGYIFQFENGEMVKAKSKWYLERHHSMTNLTERNVAECVINESIDDLKSMIFELDEPELFDKILKIEEQVCYRIHLIMKEVMELVKIGKPLERKEFALQYSRNKFFGLAIKVIEGREPDYFAFYEKHYLKQEWFPTSL